VVLKKIGGLGLVT